MGCGGSKQQTANPKKQVDSTTDKNKASTNGGATSAADEKGGKGGQSSSAAYKVADDDEEELLPPPEQEEEQKVRTKAMDRLFATKVQAEEAPNIEDELFTFGDFKVEVADAARVKAERLARMRRPVQQQKQKRDSNSQKEAIRSKAGLGDEDTFSWGDFAVATKEDEEVPVNADTGYVAPTYHQIHRYHVYTLIGHAQRVKCIAMTPQEKHFVSCSNEDTDVKMQDSITGRETHSFLGHEDTIISVCFSIDYKFLATTSRDNTMILWDVITAKQLLTFEHEKVVICCAFSRDSKFLVSGCQDKVCRIWDTRKGREVLSFTEHDGIIIAVACSPIEDLLCSASADKTVRLWTNKGETKHVLTGHQGIVLTCSFDSSGAYVVSNDEKMVKVWKVETGECTLTAVVDNYMKKQITTGIKKITWTLSAYCPGKFGHYVIVASNTKVVMMIDPDNGNEVMSMVCKAPVYCLSSGAESRIAFGDSCGNIYVMNLS